MNGGKGYITIEISQRMRRKKGVQSEPRREAPRMGEELGVHILGRGVFSPWDVGPSDSM